MRFQKRNACFITSLVFLFSIFVNSILLAQSVQIGKGSYTVELPDGQLSALDENGNSISPNIGGNFTKLEWFSSYVPVTTNDFWSSTLFRYLPKLYPCTSFSAKYNHLKGKLLLLTIRFTRAVTGSNFLMTTLTGQTVKDVGVTEINFKASSDWTATTHALAWLTICIHHNRWCKNSKKFQLASILAFY